MKISLVLRSVAARRLREFGLIPQSSLRQPLQTIQQGLQFSMLLRGGPEQRRDFRSELHIDGFAFGLIRPLEVRSMALSRIMAAGTLGFAALHHPLEQRPFREVRQ